MPDFEIFPHELGAFDVVNLLFELHQRGYQQLRLHSMMAPNGCAMRTSITEMVYLSTAEHQGRYFTKDDTRIPFPPIN